MDHRPFCPLPPSAIIPTQRGFLRVDLWIFPFRAILRGFPFFGKHDVRTPPLRPFPPLVPYLSLVPALPPRPPFLRYPFSPFNLDLSFLSRGRHEASARGLCFGSFSLGKFLPRGGFQRTHALFLLAFAHDPFRLEPSISLFFPHGSPGALGMGPAFFSTFAGRPPKENPGTLQRWILFPPPSWPLCGVRGTARNWSADNSPPLPTAEVPVRPSSF